MASHPHAPLAPQSLPCPSQQLQSPLCVTGGCFCPRHGSLPTSPVCLTDPHIWSFPSRTHCPQNLLPLPFPRHLSHMAQPVRRPQALNPLFSSHALLLPLALLVPPPGHGLPPPTPGVRAGPLWPCGPAPSGNGPDRRGALSPARPAQEEPPRTVKHYQYFSWPDHGVPAEPAGVLSFLDDVNRAQSSTPGAGPIVVHCRCEWGRGVAGTGPRGAGATRGGAGPRGHCRCNHGQGHGFVP